MSNTFNFVNTNDTTAPDSLWGIWDHEGPPRSPSPSPKTPSADCAPEEPIPPLVLSEEDFPGHPAATVDLRTTSQQECDELSLEEQARRKQALEEQALEHDAINEFERRRKQHEALAAEAAARLQREKDEFFTPEHETGDVDEGAGALDGSSSDEEECLGVTKAAAIEAASQARKAARKALADQRALEAKTQAQRDLQEALATLPRLEGYGKPHISDVLDKEGLPDLIAAWRELVQLWRTAEDPGYLEYRENRRQLLEVEEWTRADGYGKPRLPHGLKKGENAEEDAKLEVAQDRRARLVTLWKLTGDRGYQRYKQHEDEVAAAGAQRRREKAKRAREEANPGSSPAAPRRSAPKAAPAPPATNYAGVREVLNAGLEKLTKSVWEELKDVDSRLKHADDLSGYLTDAKACYVVALQRVRELEGSGAVVPNISWLRANGCWDESSGSAKTKGQLNDQGKKQLQSVKDAPSAGHQLPLGAILEQLESAAWVCSYDAWMLKWKIREMNAMVAGVLGNRQFLSEAASADPESNESKVLDELQSKGLLKASPHDLANWMLSLNTQNSEPALKILSGAWDGSIQWASLLGTATDGRIPEVGVRCDELGLLREALSTRPQKEGAETLEGGEAAPAPEVSAPRDAEEDTQLATKLAECKSLHKAHRDLKRDKSATTEAVKRAERALESARKELAGFGTFLTLRIFANGICRPALRDKKELKPLAEDVKNWAKKQRESEEAKLKGPLTTVDKTFAEKRIWQLGPHFAEQQFDFARGLYGSILEYFNAQFYMCLLVLSTLAPEFCSTLSFKPWVFKEEPSRSEATPHEVATWVLEEHTNFPNLERPFPGAVAHFKHHQTGEPSSNDTGAGADAEEGESEEGGDMEVDSEAAGAGLEADEDTELAETQPLEDPEEGGQEATQALEVAGQLEANEATQLEETQPLEDPEEGGQEATQALEVPGQLEANEATQLEETQPLGDMVVDGHTEAVEGAVEIAPSEEDAVVEPPKKRRKPRREPSRDEEGEALQPRTSGRTRKRPRQADEWA